MTTARRFWSAASWQLPADLALVFFLLAAGPHTQPEVAHQPARLFVLAALVAPLPFRRWFPLPTFLVMSAVAFVQWLMFAPAAADAALLLAFYSVAVSGSRRQVVAAAGVLEIGVLLAVLRYTNGPPRLAFVFLSGLVTAAGVLGVSVRTRRAYLQEVEARAARLEFERDQQAQLAVSAERARVAREMHDIVAHNLSVMIALTDGAALTLTTDPRRAGGALSEASRAGRAALADMRRVLGVLRDDDDPAALAPAPGLTDLEQLLGAVRHTGLDVRYETTGPLTHLEPAVQLSAYRIVQEAVTNTIKHADGATRVDVLLDVAPNGVEVRIRDNGRGVQQVRPEETGGHGLVGMRERAAVHAGEVAAGPTVTGWLVRAWLPTEIRVPALA